TTATSTTSYTESNEFGVPYFQASAYPRYGWLGAKQRSHDTLSGITLMGVRLYNPDSGRFDQTDPVPGGSANPYDYANQDPINQFDLTGQFSCRLCHAVKKHWRGIAVVASGIAGVAASGACGLSVVCGIAVGAAFSYAAYAAATRHQTLKGAGQAAALGGVLGLARSEEHTSQLQSHL